MRNCCKKELRRFAVWARSGVLTAKIILEGDGTEIPEYARGVGYAYSRMVEELAIRSTGAKDEDVDTGYRSRPPARRPPPSRPTRPPTKPALYIPPVVKAISEACETGLHNDCMMAFCPCPCQRK